MVEAENKLIWVIIISIIIMIIIFIVVYIYYETIDNVINSIIQQNPDNLKLLSKIQKKLTTGKDKLKFQNVSFDETLGIETLFIEPEETAKTIIIASNKNSKVETSLKYDIIEEAENTVIRAFYVNPDNTAKISIVQNVSKFQNKKSYNSIINVFQR